MKDLYKDMFNIYKEIWNNRNWFTPFGKLVLIPTVILLPILVTLLIPFALSKKDA